MGRLNFQTDLSGKTYIVIGCILLSCLDYGKKIFGTLFAMIQPTKVDLKGGLPMYRVNQNVIKAKNFLNYNNNLSLEKKDIRGFFVRDRNHHKIGTVSEIYCDRFDLQPRYIEITPLNEFSEKIYIYPIECARWRKNGPVFIESTKESLEKYETYDLDHILASEGNELITYNESLDSTLTLFDDEGMYCA